MTKLSTFSRYLASYLKIHGDKEVLSVASCHNYKDQDFIVHMADIYDGPFGNNPFTGRDELPIPAGDANDSPAYDEETVFEEGYQAGYQGGYDEGYAQGHSSAYEEHSDERKVTTTLFAVLFILSVLNLAARYKKGR